MRQGTAAVDQRLAAPNLQVGVISADFIATAII